MDYSYFLGIDMAKRSFDYCLIDDQGSILHQDTCENDVTSILEWIASMEVNEPSIANSWNSILVCIEHSGFYSSILLHTLYQSVEANIWVESALQIKRSIGVQRGKSDKLDAMRIATYTLDFQRKAILWTPLPKCITRLKMLLSHRDRLVRCLMSLENTLNEQRDFVDPVLQNECDQLNEAPIEAVRRSIFQIEDKIEALLREEQQLTRIAEIVTSVPGFGNVIASKIITATEGFTRLTDPRSFACYAGVAPFEHSSGTSIKGRNRVSHLANKDIKKMLHMAALVTIRKGNIMYNYYKRKVEEGKNPMSVINAIRNKLIHILFACIYNDVTYDRNYNVSV